MQVIELLNCCNYGVESCSRRTHIWASKRQNTQLDQVVHDALTHLLLRRRARNLYVSLALSVGDPPAEYRSHLGMAAEIGRGCGLHLLLEYAQNISCTRKHTRGYQSAAEIPARGPHEGHRVRAT